VQKKQIICCKVCAVARTVRDATFAVLREYGLTTLFANPGSTEIDLLSDLPDDLRFVLALHESSAVGMATGWALGRGEPALVILHTTPGLGNGVSALATARVNRAPLVVVVGQQDRRHLPAEPFLTGKLHGLAGDYPVWVDQPVRAQGVPGAVARAYHEARTGRGPAIVIVPMDDWAAPDGGEAERAAPRAVVRAAGADARLVDELGALLAGAERPALVVGAGVDDAEGWAAVVALAERLACPVWQESFSGRAGFPQDHALFAGHLPADRPRLRELLSPHDAVLAVGAPAFRQYAFAPGPFVEPGTTVAVVSGDAAEVHRSAADLAVLGSPAAICAALADAVPARDAAPLAPFPRPADPAPLAPGEPLRPGHVFAAFAGRLAPETVVFEESPSNRPELLARLPARQPLGMLSPAMGGLGFALPAATGIRMARPDLPVVAFVGDGSSLYAIQALWSAAQYGAGALFVILANGGYAVMDELLEVLDEVVPGLAGRDEPLLLEVVVAPDDTFSP
jgi:benzoylformate decarboxylase